MISFLSDSGASLGLVMATALVASSVLSSGFCSAFAHASLGPYPTGRPGHAELLRLDPTLTNGYVVWFLYL